MVSKPPFVVDREVKEAAAGQDPEKHKNPSILRELFLGRIADRLGESKTWDQRSNNAFVYYTLPTYSSFLMAFEERMRILTNEINATITGCSCDAQPCKKHGGRSVLIKGGLFENTMTLSKWIINFFQQSPSINARARDDQVEIAKAGYAVQTQFGFGTTPTHLDINAGKND